MVWLPSAPILELERSCGKDWASGVLASQNELLMKDSTCCYRGAVGKPPILLQVTDRPTGRHEIRQDIG